MATISEMLAQAVQCHEAGNLSQAEQLYRQILHADPTHADALHRLGVLAHQGGQHHMALEFLSRALALLPDRADFHANLAAVHRTLGRSDKAVTSYAHALHLRPDIPELHNKLGIVQAEQGQLTAALASFREALRLRPAFADAHNNEGNVLGQMQRHAEAESSYRAALRLFPGNVDALNHLGAVLAEQARFVEALACYQEALHLRPDFADAYYNLGLALTAQGKVDEALASYEQAVRLRPDFVMALNNLANGYMNQARLDEAINFYRMTLRLRPDLPLAHFHLGRMLAKQGKIDEAIASYEQAVRIKPNLEDAWSNLVIAYKDQGRTEEAIAALRKAIATNPASGDLHSNLLLTLHYSANYDPESTFAEHLRWGKQFGESAATYRPLGPSNRDPTRRLRIGYVSHGFFDVGWVHSCEDMIVAHDHGPFEIFCYAAVRFPDPLTQRVRASADHWRCIAELSDAQAADLIRRDRIDLLVDLTGHFPNHRLGVFALKPAPIQVTFFNYPASTGLAAMDYRLTDASGDPPGQTERFYCEKLVRLPDVRFCYAPPPGPEVGALPADKREEVTFGCFHNLAKVTEPMIGLWCKIMRELPESRIIVVTGTGSAADERICAAFARHGTSKERLRLAGRARRNDYLRLYHEIDIALDTYPFTSCFTTADAVWMGVPVVTLAGPTFLTRQGVEILTQVGLEDLIAYTPEGYCEAAIRLARDLPRLQALRGQLRARLARSPLGDVPRFARHVEAAYRAMWEHYCQENTFAPPQISRTGRGEQ